MKTKPVNPYDRLLGDVSRFLSDVRFPTRKRLWHYSIAKLNDRAGFDLLDLFHRTAAADLLGFDTILKSTDEGLVVEFRKRPDESKLPWSLK